MPSMEPTRTTRQPAIGRFRRERLARREQDLLERQSLLLKVAERLVVVMHDAQAFLSDAKDKRLTEEQLLREALAQFRVQLSDQTISSLVDARAARLSQKEADQSTRAADLAALREEVVRLVSEDFR